MPFFPIPPPPVAASSIPCRPPALLRCPPIQSCSIAPTFPPGLAPGLPQISGRSGTVMLSLLSPGCLLPDLLKDRPPAAWPPSRVRLLPPVEERAYVHPPAAIAPVYVAFSAACSVAATPAVSCLSTCTEGLPPLPQVCTRQKPRPPWTARPLRAPAPVLVTPPVPPLTGLHLAVFLPGKRAGKNRWRSCSQFPPGCLLSALLRPSR